MLGGGLGLGCLPAKGSWSAKRPAPVIMNRRACSSIAGPAYWDGNTAGCRAPRPLSGEAAGGAAHSGITPPLSVVSSCVSC